MEEAEGDGGMGPYELLATDLQSCAWTSYGSLLCSSHNPLQGCISVERAMDNSGGEAVGVHCPHQCGPGRSLAWAGGADGRLPGRSGDQAGHEAGGDEGRSESLCVAVIFASALLQCVHHHLYIYICVCTQVNPSAVSYFSLSAFADEHEVNPRQMELQMERQLPPPPPPEEGCMDMRYLCWSRLQLFVEVSCHED